MKLAEYLETCGESGNHFAERLGVPAITVQRYLKGRIPTPEIMRAIFDATGGRVEPNDFYDVKRRVS